jgi:CRISPR-associated protein Cas1
MSFKSIILNNPAYLSINLSNLKIHLFNTKEDVLIPIEDIAIIVLDNPQISITREVLTLCSNLNVAIITTDEAHMPCGIMLPCYNYFKGYDVLNLQINIKQSLKDAIWKVIIKNKLSNQAKVLSALNLNGANQLENLILKVQNADKDNLEAIGARIYFINLFNNEFNRRDDNILNTLLNYGYAIIRSSLAKSIASKGLHCSLGIHHASVLNNFNLADDLIEIFRPTVDYHVYKFIFNTQNHEEIQSNITKQQKEYLVNILNTQILSTKGSIKIITACDMLVDSLIKAYKNNNYQDIITLNFNCNTE